MSAEITRLDLRLRGRMAAWCAAGMAAYALLIVAIYPAFKDDASLDALTRDSSTLAALFGATGSLTSVDGWLNANLYANFVPLIAFLLTIGYGASAIAGQNEDGSLGLTATLPLRRSRILAGKAGALAALACVVPMTTLLCLLLGPKFELKPDWSATTQTTLGVVLMALDIGLLALAVGAITASRGTALGVTSAFAALSYLVSSLAPVVDWVHSVRHLSLFYWSVGNNQLTDGISLASITVMTTFGGLLLLVALKGFDRLDLH